ncbi:MAG: primosomal protein N' [Fusobacteriaceae bacterium]|jgi:primosomal protein N' (replication factor Y)|nr:primosomal protein N' [Fusobacteriaceae bacterium]
MKYYKIFVDNTKNLFTYSDENNQYEVGDRVKVQFRNKLVSGMIVAPDEDINKSFNVLPIKEKLYDEIKLEPKYIELLIWISDYYMCPIGNILGAVMPKNLKVQYDIYYELADKNMFIYNILDPIVLFLRKRLETTKATLLKKFPKEIINRMIEAKILLKNSQKISLDLETYNKNNNFDFKQDEKTVIEYFQKRMKISSNVFKSAFADRWEKLLKDKIFIEVKDIKDRFEKNILSEVAPFENKVYDIDKQKNKLENLLIELNDEQKTAKDAILNGSKQYYLLRGITGSGKTEIYIEIIKEAFLSGNGSIFLVPEISLTPQLISRFKKTFGNNIAILHSHLTLKDRTNEWYSIYTGEKKIVLGVRSAIFAPVRNLKYIILDEEHETTYKQDTNPRYHAKFVALKRAQLENLKVIFGSATPSVESFYYTKTGLFDLVKMDKRYNDSYLPEVQMVDMKGEENIYFSKILLKEIRNSLMNKEQVILFLNRKGYSTYIQCTDCGYVEECEHCSIKYSYYASQRIYKCNYCGDIRPYTGKCSKCGSQNIVHSGKGIERIEEEIKKYFDVPIISVDSEKAKEKEFYNRVYRDFADKKYSIMIGTQVVSKGLHFPNVTLVGVINADTILNFPDFRSGEKTYQIITQVSGRAGRGEKKGKVIVQTYQPENYTFQSVKDGNYDDFYRTEIKMRELLQYPPFSKTINIGISSKIEEYLGDFLKKFKKEIEDPSVIILGPMKSLIYKVSDRFRYNIFIKGDRKAIVHYKRKLAKILANYENEKNVRIVIDIDPVNLI